MERRCIDYNTSGGFVELVAVSATEADICQMARCSYGAGTKSVREDAGLIDYLWRHQHTSPFERPDVVLHVQAPLFVARQLVRHRTHSMNELSARYSEVEDLFWVPDQVRGQGNGPNKQVSDGELPTLVEQQAENLFHLANVSAMNKYTELLALGVSREQARAVLPQSMYTRFFWKQNLLNFLKMLTLRVDEHAQFETREMASAMRDLVAPYFPTVFASWEKHTRGAVTFAADELAAIGPVEGTTHQWAEALGKSRLREFFAKVSKCNT